MPDARKIYRLLLRFYPARFREEYAGPLERQFADDYREARGAWARARFWAAALVDLAVAIPSAFAGEILQDLRYAGRVYRQRLPVAALALTAMAMAIGITTGVFSVLDAVLLRSLPFRNPDRLVQLSRLPVQSGDSPSAFAEWRRSSRYLQDAALFRSAPMNLAGAGGSRRVQAAEVTADFFSLLGTEPEFGRAFAPGEDAPGGQAFAILSHALWENAFGGDPRALGSVIRLNGVPLTVVGMAPPAMDFPGRTDVWTTTLFDPGRIPMEAPAFFNTAIGRLWPGVSLAQASTLLRAEDPPGIKESDRTLLNPLREQLAGPIRQASAALMAVVALVLLIACANVAHLLMSRVSERRQELVVRAALGASRARRVQQLTTESLLLTLAAAAAGLPVAWWAARMAGIVQPAALGVQRYTILDWRVLGFAAATALAMGLIFGVLPASLIGRLQPAGDPLRTQVRSHGVGVRSLRGALLALQAAVTVGLLAGTVTLGRTFLRLTGTDLGFRTNGVVTFTVSLAGSQTEREHSAARFYGEVLDRLRATPGVESAGAVEYLPLAARSFAIFGYRSSAAGFVVGASPNAATPGYFAALGIPLLEGREFTAADDARAAPVVIVTENLARRLEGGASVVGRRLQMAASPGGRASTIVGVVRAPLAAGPGGPPFAQVYQPAQQSAPDFLTFVAKVRGRPAPYLALCREAARQADPSAAVYNATTLDDLLAGNLARPRFYAAAMTFFGGFALLLALIGIHGAAAHSILQRTHEIGVRLALGSSPAGLRAKLVRESLLPVVAGIAAGIALAMAYPLDARTCAAAALAMALAALLSAWQATRRIVRVDPAQVLRAE